MKKTFALLLFAAVVVAPAFAQDKPKAGDVIYGRIVDSNGPVVGAKVTERNDCDRIMAQTTTDVNGEFSFRTVNPDNRIMVTNRDYETIDIPINKTCFDLKMKKQSPIPPVTILDGPADLSSLIPEIPTAVQIITDQDLIALFGATYTSQYSDMLLYPIEGMMKADRTYQKMQIPGNGIYIPYTNHTTYYTIDELFDNWYPRF